MQATLCREPFEFILIDNTYTEEELRLIFLELDFWALSGNLKDPEDTGAAKFDDGTTKKKNKGSRKKMVSSKIRSYNYPFPKNGIYSPFCFIYSVQDYENFTGKRSLSFIKMNAKMSE